MILEPPKTIKAIPGYPGYYADIDGSIWSYKTTNRWAKKYKWRHLKGSVKKSGYVGIVLYSNGQKKHTHIHHLICLAFLGERPKGFDINHKDGVKTNNKLVNLEYCTKSENVKHAFKFGLRKNNMTQEIARLGGKAKALKVQPRKVIGIKDNKIVYRFNSAKETANKLGIGLGNLKAVLSGNKKCLLQGYRWKYYKGVNYD